MLIREWALEQLSYLGPKVIIEAGAHDGRDTAWLAALPEVTVFALEPDPANAPRMPLPFNASWHYLALGAKSERRQFWPSKSRHGRPYTKSGSILRPTGHLKRHPDVLFGEPFDVDVVALDEFAERHGIEDVDLIWLDVQGAEGEVIAGGKATLARTRYLYTEHCSDEPLYDGEPTLAELLALLPGWQVRHTWPDDVLLENAA
jgi:FkbM family methyltransferase